MSFGRREILFSLNCFVAAICALYISFAAGLERPFWAMVTVYITSQPLSGAVRSKAVFRLCGTVVGATATVLMVPALVNAPILLSLALALWVALCQFISLLDRTPSSYFFMLAGYTAALIGFPSVARPELIFQTAVLRAQEIGIGVLCAAFFHTIFFPRSVSETFAGRLQAIMGDAQDWTVQVLSGRHYEAGVRDPRRRQLAMDVTELHMMATHVPYDTARLRPTRATLAALQDRMLLLPPLVTAIEDRIAALQGRGGLSDAMAALIGEVRTWVEGQRDAQEAERLRLRIEAWEATVDKDDWDALLTYSLLVRLRELVALFSGLRALVAHVADPEGVPQPDIAAFITGRMARPLHRDLALNLLSATATVVAIMGCCAFWILTAWPEGYVAAMIAAVICCFFATMDDPTPAQRSFGLWTAISLPFVALYLFALLPLATDFVTVILLLAPFLLPVGVLLAMPRWAGRMMPMLVGFTGGLALTNSFAADFEGFANGSIGQLGGVFAALVATRILRVIGAETAARRVLRSGWQDLALAANSPAAFTLPEWTSRMLDRVNLLAPRLASVPKDQPLATTDALRDLRIGINVIQLQELAQAGGGACRATIQALLRGIGQHFAALVRGRTEPPAPETLTCLDKALAASAGLPEQADRQRARAALTGLRRNLFPEAPPYDAALAQREVTA